MTLTPISRTLTILSFQAAILSSLAAQPLPDIFNVDNLNGTNGVIFEAPFYASGGRSFGALGDLNGDGLPDFIIGTGTRTLKGRSYVVYGRPEWPASVKLDDITAADGFTIEGIDSGDYAGFDVSGVGDFNGDGRDDIVVGARLANCDDTCSGKGNGEVYILFGQDSTPEKIDLAQLTEDQMVIIVGEDAGDLLSDSLDAPGDVNGDGFDDLLVGSYNDSGGTHLAGKGYLLYGSAEAGGTIHLNDPDGINGVEFFGDEFYDSGSQVAAAGDVNADGIPDLLFGGPSNLQGVADRAYLVYGRTDFPAEVRLTELGSSEGAAFEGGGAKSWFGYAVAGGADVNADGFDDLLISAHDTGDAYLIYGHPGLTGLIDADALPPSEATLFDTSVRSWDVELVPDFNRDGHADLVVGSSFDAAYLIFGASDLPGTIVPDDLDGTNGTFMWAPVDLLGIAIGNAGDPNGDGFDDFLLGAPDYVDGFSGAYLIFGKATEYVEVAVNGSCPGPVTISIDGIVSNAGTALYASRETGNLTLDSGPCAGTTLGLADRQAVLFPTADEFGNIELFQELGNALCNAYVQVIDETTCRLSEVVQLP